MEAALFTNVKLLYDNELHSCVIPTASLLNSLLQNDRNSEEYQYQNTLFAGNAHYYERSYRQASKHLDAALLLRKTMLRNGYKSALLTIEGTYDDFREVEVRFRLAQCYRELGEQNLAIATLQAVPAKMRTPKVNLLLGKLLHHGRSPGESTAAFKDVLRECPMALDAVEALLQLGVDGNEVNSLVLNATAVSKNIDWLSNWIKAHAQMYGSKHLEASKTFQAINDTTAFHQNEHLLTLIGKCLYYYGNFIQAQHFLETAAMINPYDMEALMPLAVVYEYNQKLPELERLTTQMTNINEFTSGHWFVLAQNFYSSGKLERATSFTHKAIAVNARNVEAQLLRGKICLRLKRHKDAIYFFRAAQYIANYRFEVHKGLFHCYMGLKRVKDAQTICAHAVRYFHNSPRSFVMFARSLFQSANPLAKKSAKRFVINALDIDEHYAPAVALMAEVCQAEGETQEAIAMLKKQVIQYPHHKLYTMLGDILSTEKDLNGSLEYYTIALSMEPTYQRAIDGLNALGQASRSTPTGRQEQQDASLAVSSHPPEEEWPIDEPSIEAVELSSPAIALDADGESDTFSDPFWQDVDTELTN